MHTDEHELRTTSRDGTTLTVTVGGAGPPLVLVHGSLLGHRHLDLLVAELRSRATTYALDRRGFGDSGDSDSVVGVMREVSAHLLRSNRTHRPESGDVSPCP